MRQLTPDETRRALAEARLDRPHGLGFAFHDQAPGGVGGVAYHWHDHDYHQLLYALSGTAQLEAHGARHFLPPQRAAWIPAGTRHRTLLSSVEGASVFLAPTLMPEAPAGVRIIAATPMMREMMAHALRWPVGSNGGALAESFFTTLALLCGEWLSARLDFALPTSDHPAIARAIDLALRDPAAVDQAAAASAAHLSQRSFRRLFAAATGMGWQAWRTQARLLAAMARLEQGARVTDVAADVGFASLSAFAKAFTRLTGESPSTYRRAAYPRAPRR